MFKTHRNAELVYDRVGAILIKEASKCHTVSESLWSVSHCGSFSFGGTC